MVVFSSTQPPPLMLSTIVLEAVASSFEKTADTCNRCGPL